MPEGLQHPKIMHLKTMDDKERPENNIVPRKRCLRPQSMAAKMPESYAVMAEND